MNSTTNEKILYFRTLEKKYKEVFIKHYTKESTNGYNFYKNSLKENTTHIDFYTLRMKCFMSQVLLYNSILKNNKENIIKNFNNFNELQLEYMEMLEEISGDEKCEGFAYNTDDEDDKITKPGEKYRLGCIEIKEKYEFFKYLIEDYNNIKL